MNRKYTVAQYAKRRSPGFRAYARAACVTTDLIVAFPGESEADFEPRSHCANESVSRKPSCSSIRRGAARRPRTGSKSPRRWAANAADGSDAVNRRARARLARSASRHDRARADPRRLAQRSHAPGGQDADNVTVHFPDDRSERRTSPNRGSTSRRSRGGHVGRARARRRHRASAWDAPAASGRGARHRSRCDALAR
jgi:hypothetical protein